VRVRSLVTSRPDCFERSCLPGHLTGSAWVLSPDRRSFLLTHHRKLGRWLQLGGHADGESDLAAVALREAREESGLERFAFLGEPGAAMPQPIDHDVHAMPQPIDLDVHAIPASPGEPAHEHHDLRFALVALGGEARASSESHALRWFDMASLDSELEAIGADQSLLRLGRKVRALLAAASPARERRA